VKFHGDAASAAKIHHGDTETRRKQKARLESTEVAEDTEG